MGDRELLTRAGLLRLAVFWLGLFALLSMADDFAFFKVARFQLLRADSARPLWNSAVYAGAYVGGVCGLAALYLHPWSWIRIPAYAVSALSLAVFLGFRSVNGYGFAYHEAALIWAEMDFIPDALRFFFSSYAVAVIGSFVGFGLFGWLVEKGVPRPRSAAWLLLPIVAGLGFHRLLEQTYSKVYQSPIPYRVPLLAFYAREHRIPYYGRREEPRLEPSGAPIADHVVLVMDESVTGDLLGINGGHPDTTPYLASLGSRVLNYGVVSSISNLSSNTNLALQAGLRPDQVPDRELRSLKNANVFSYFQRAGFAAHLIDDQVYSGRPNNMMSVYDLERLDGHHQLRALEPEVSDELIDFVAVDYVERIVRGSERSFTYLIKAGAHFPYDAKYPAREGVFQPTLSGGGSASNLERTLNSYHNALRWTVDAFARELVTRLEASGRRVVVVYTSDHGQSLWSAADDSGDPLPGRPRRWPHGIPVDPPSRQASVPLLLMGFGDDVQAALSSRYHANLRDRVSQWELFSTLLELAGYAAEDVRRYHTRSLFDPSPRSERRIFVSGNLFGIGGGFYNHELVESSCHVNEFVLDERSFKRGPS